MNDNLKQLLSSALAYKKLNLRAHDRIVLWLRDEEYAEYRDVLSERIEKGEWDTLMDQFYTTVIFNTAGIRGVMDVGTNRINNATIRMASEALSQFLLKHKPDIAKKGIAIAYDSRNNSVTYMEETARVMAANGIPVFIFKYYRATPELSFVVRYLKLAGGIVITASHNPPEFNGYKVYDERGVQVLPKDGLRIEEEFQSIERIAKIPFKDALERGLVSYIDDEVDKAFAESAKKVSVYPGRDAKIVFSPLHGVGSESVLPVLKSVGFEDIVTVKDQMSIDGNFPNVANHFPNPEFPVIYKEAIDLAKSVKANIVLVSDPDADRLGMAVPDKDANWYPLSGNQGAVLMGYFFLHQLKESGRMPKRPVVIKTSVTTELVADIAKYFGAEVIGDLLVGFKFIGDRQENLSLEKTFLFGCEESVGYSFSNDYREKGAETPAIIAAEMASWCKANNMTPMDLLDSIYEAHGYYSDRLWYRLIEGLGSMEQMNEAMKMLRENLPKEVGGRKILKVLDRKTGEVRKGDDLSLIEKRDWDQGDMISLFFTEDERTAIHIRPSGTEPKMKIYTSVKGKLQEKSRDQIEEEALVLEKSMIDIFEGFLSQIKINVY